METSETPSHDQTNDMPPTDGGSADDKTASQPEATTEMDWKAEAEKWKALSRKNEETAKANVEKAKAYEAWQESQKTVEEKRQDEVKRLNSERDEALRRAMAAEAALKYGLTADDLALLGGSDADSFDERAKALAERLNPRSPGRDPNLGLENTSSSVSHDWIRQALKR